MFVLPCFQLVIYISVSSKQAEYITIVSFQRKSNLTVLSCNIAGLRSYEKTSAVIGNFLYAKDKTKHPHIYTFQETWSSIETLPFLDGNLPGKKVYSHSTERSQGIVMGFMPDFQGELVSSISDAEGRYRLADCNFHGQELVIASIYIHPFTSAEQSTNFLNEVEAKIESFHVENVIWCGDFNALLNPQMDAKQEDWWGGGGTLLEGGKS